MQLKEEQTAEQLNSEAECETRITHAEEAAKTAEEPAVLPDAENCQTQPEEKTEEEIPQGKKGKKSRKDKAEDAFKNFEGRTVEPPKKRKYGWVGTVLLLVVIGFSIWMMLEIVMSSGDEAKSLGEIISGSDWKFALITFAVIIVIIACICLEYCMVLKATTGRFKFRMGIKVAFLGKFYDNITPFATGGQPMQIYYLHKKGLSGGVSSAVIFIKYFVWMISWLVVSLLLMACNTGVIGRIENSAWRTVISVCGWIGLGINMLLPLMVLLFVAVPKLANKLASLVVGAGAKIKIVKDKQKTLEKADKVVNDFRSSFIIMSHHPVLFVALIILCVAEVSLTFALPYFIMRMFSGITSPDVSTLFYVTALNVYVIMAVSVIPTPGNTGAMEGLGALAFSAFCTGSVQFWSMLGWRFAVYYVFIVIGLGITVFDFIRRLVRQVRAKRENK